MVASQEVCCPCCRRHLCHHGHHHPRNHRCCRPCCRPYSSRHHPSWGAAPVGAVVVAVAGELVQATGWELVRGLVLVRGLGLFLVGTHPSQSHLCSTSCQEVVATVVGAGYPNLPHRHWPTSWHHHHRCHAHPSSALLTGLSLEQLHSTCGMWRACVNSRQVLVDRRIRGGHISQQVKGRFSA